MLQMFVSSRAQASETFIDQLWPPNLKINPLYVIHNDLRMPTSLSLYKISNTSIQIIHNLFLPLKNYIVSKQFKMADENLHKSMLKMSAQDFRVLQIFLKQWRTHFPYLIEGALYPWLLVFHPPSNFSRSPYFARKRSFALDSLYSPCLKFIMHHNVQIPKY